MRYSDTCHFDHGQYTNGCMRGGFSFFTRNNFHSMLPIFERKSFLRELVDEIVQDYKQSNLSHHLDHCPLPNYNSVISVIEDLKEVFYPGYRRRDQLHSSNVEYHVGDLVDRLHDRLVILFERALCPGDGDSCHCSAEKKQAMGQLAQEKAIAFLKNIPTIRATLVKDVEAAHAGDPACKSLDEVIFCYPGLEAVTVYRVAHSMHDLAIPLIPRMMTEWAHSKTGIDIHPGAKIGEYFFIDHGTGVVIGETCEIGRWVKLYQGVTLGALSFPKDEHGELVRGTKRHPTIEDNVVIYASATILGGETVIGKSAVIGSSVWITASVAPNTTVTIKKPELRVRHA